MFNLISSVNLAFSEGLPFQLGAADFADFKLIVRRILSVACGAVKNPVQPKAYAKSHERRKLHSYLVSHILDGIVICDNKWVMACVL